MVPAEQILAIDVKLTQQMNQLHGMYAQSTSTTLLTGLRSILRQGTYAAECCDCGFTVHRPTHGSMSLTTNTTTNAQTSLSSETLKMQARRM